MSRLRASLSTLALGLLVAAGAALLATDPPHNIATVNAFGTSNYCSTCHKTHGAAGGAITTTSGNANLCLSCHVPGNTVGATDTFVPADQAVPAGATLVGSAAAGTSHRWDSSAAGRIIKGTPNSSTGTITPSGDYTGPYAATIQLKVTTGGATGTAVISWSQTTNNTATLGSATALTTSTSAQALGTTGVSLAFSSTGTFVLNDIFYLYVRPDLVNPTSTMSLHTQSNQIMCSTCHDQHLQANAPFDPAAPQTYTAGAINNRHFQRLPNASDQMCVDCHSPRNVTAKGGTSHPITLPLPATSDFKTPTTAKLSVTSNVECQSCHDIHKAPTANGLLLRAEATGAAAGSSPLCSDCHTYATVTTNKGVHFDPTKGVLWPGGKYGSTISTYPAFNYSTDAAKRATCANCHDPHGWPDARTTNAKYAKLAIDDPDNLCLACHHGTSSAPYQLTTTGTAQTGIPDINTEINKTIHHPIERTSGRTVMCADCHNPHKAVAGSHTYSTTATSTRNLILNGTTVQSGPLMGVDGVTPTWGGFWTTASSYTAKTTATYEYEVCFKCHTSYSFGSTPPPGLSGGTSNIITDTGTAGPGQITLSNGSTTVQGNNTNWSSTWVGRYLQNAGESTKYRITAVSGQTTATITPAYSGTGGSNLSWTWYNSASVNVGTNAVTGYGTSWTTSLVGSTIQFTGDAATYVISTVPSATSLTLTTNYTGTSKSYAFFTLTVSANFTNGSTTVTGNGTNWTSALVGSAITRAGDSTSYTITAVASATSLTIKTAYAGTTGTKLGFSIALVETDLAQEFTPANHSGHPVATGLNNYTGSPTPKALIASQMSAPFATNLGTQTMMCSDCHNTDGAAAQGPHGSANQFLLKGSNPYWPTNSAGSPYGLGSNPTSNAHLSGLFCLNCHPMFTGTSNSTTAWAGNAVHYNHSGPQVSNALCINCHIIVPHGGKVSRLIATNTAGLPARYAGLGNVSNVYVTQFKKAAGPGSYSTGNCNTSCGGHGSVTGAETW